MLGDFFNAGKSKTVTLLLSSTYYSNVLKAAKIQFVINQK